MAGGALRPPRGHHVDEPRAVRFALIGLAAAFLAAFLVVPLIAVFAFALREGLGVYLDALREPAARAAVTLTLTVA